MSPHPPAPSIASGPARARSAHSQPGPHYCCTLTAAPLLQCTCYILCRPTPLHPPSRSFFGGRAYLLLPTDFLALHHHARLHVAYIRMLLHLEDTFGGPQPDLHQQQQQEQGQQEQPQGQQRRRAEQHYQQQGRGQDGAQQVLGGSVLEPPADSPSSSPYSSQRRQWRRVKQEGDWEQDAGASSSPADATGGSQVSDGGGNTHDSSGTANSSSGDSSSTNSPSSGSRPGSSSSSSIPDVVFVLTTSDTPRYTSPLLYNTTHPPDRRRDPLAPGGDFVPGPYPVAAIGKSDFWPDTLLVPNFHNHM